MWRAAEPHYRNRRDEDKLRPPCSRMIDRGIQQVSRQKARLMSLVTHLLDVTSIAKGEIGSR